MANLHIFDTSVTMCERQSVWHMSPKCERSSRRYEIRSKQEDLEFGVVWCELMCVIAAYYDLW